MVKTESREATWVRGLHKSLDSKLKAPPTNIKESSMIENTFVPQITPKLLNFIHWELEKIENNLKKGIYNKNSMGKKNKDPINEAFIRVYKMLEEISLYGTHDAEDAPFYGWVKANIEIELFRQFKEFYKIVD